MSLLCPRTKWPAQKQTTQQDTYRAKKHMLHVNELSKETMNIEYICKHFNSIQCFISPYKEDIEQAIYNM